MAEELQRNYIVPLRRGYAKAPRYYRAKKAVSVLKAFLVKHMKSENIKIGPKLNEIIWCQGIRNPPARVKITATKDKYNVVRAELEGVNYVDFKMAEKVDKNASMKEKLQSSVKEATGKKEKTEKTENKEDTKTAEKTTEKAPSKESSKKTDTKVTEEKKEAKPASTPKETKEPVKEDKTTAEEKKTE